VPKIKLKNLLFGLKENWPLARETNFGLGGPARYFFRATSKADLLKALSVAKQLKIKTFVLGSGTNVAISDRGFSGLVIKFENQNPHQSFYLNKRLLIAEASVLLADLLKFSFKHDLAGLEKMAGIPGTLGGAIVGNAGAYGQMISDQVIWVEIFDGQKIRQVSKSTLKFNYRDSLFKQRPTWLVLRVAFKLLAGERKILQAESRKIIAIRNNKYPAGIKSAGSFFKNLPVTKIPNSVRKKIHTEKIKAGKIPAAYLLEQSNVGGMTVGGMAVSHFHHNFLINTGTGTYCDLRLLVRHLKKKVYRQFGLELEEEVRYIN